jgi:hypothetical protein
LSTLGFIPDDRRRALQIDVQDVFELRIGRIAQDLWLEEGTLDMLDEEVELLFQQTYSTRVDRIQRFGHLGELEL